METSPNIATAEDVICLYRNLLGREPELAEVVEKRVGKPLIDIAVEFALSNEFCNRVASRTRREQVVGLYNALLQRQPKSEKAIKSKTGRPIVDVVAEIVNTVEFKNKCPIQPADVVELHELLNNGSCTENAVSQEIARIATLHRVGLPTVAKHIVAMAAAKQAIKNGEVFEGMDWTEPQFGGFDGKANPREQYELVIPTINSERWLGNFLHYYKVNNLLPIYAVDSRTSDGTRDLIREYGFDFIEVRGDEPRVEALLPSIAAQIQAPWILRLDDDELPTPKVLEFAAGVALEDAVEAYSFPRANLRRNPISRRLERSYLFAFGPKAGLDRQWRLFKPKSVTYVSDLHTPGFRVSQRQSAPPDTYILHFDWVLRSKQTRQTKFETYERQSPRAARNCKHHTLYEVVPDDWHLFQEVRDKTIQGFAKELPEI